MGLLDFCRFLLLLLAMACSVISCTGLNSLAYEEDIDPKARQMLDEALDAPVKDRVGRLEALICAYPDYVDAHRAFQNLLLLENRQGYLVNTYRQRLEEDPENPLNQYLYARLLSNPDQQLAYFSAAARKDPSFFWAHNGLGYAYINAGDFKRSEAAYQQAIRSAPGKIEPYQGLASAYLATGKLDEAEELLAAATGHFPDAPALWLLKYRWLAEKEGPAAGLGAMIQAPHDLDLGAEFFLLLLNLVDRGATDYDAKRILYRFGPLSGEDFPYNGALDLVLGACCRKLGKVSGALHHFERVYANHPGDSRTRRELRFLYAVDFRLEAACAIEVADYPAEWLETSALIKSRPKLIELSKKVEEEKNEESGMRAAYELASLLVRHGWLDEAMHFLYLFSDPQSTWGAKSAALLEQVYKHRHFELTLRDFFTEQYQSFRGTGNELGWEETLEHLSTLSSRILGRDIFADAVVMDYRPVGILLDPCISAGSAHADYFRSFNRFFLLGRKLGGPVEACLLDICDYQPETTGKVAGGEVVFDLILCENLRIPSLVEQEGGNIVGAALSSFIFINLDLIRQKVYEGERVFATFKDKEDALLNDPFPKAEDEDERCSIEEPWGVSRRLKYLSFKEESSPSSSSLASYMAARTDAVLRHELQHLADAKRFLPVLHNLMWKFYHLAALGFSAANIEAWLEERAQMHALLAARDSYAALSEVADYLGGGDFQSPYRKGYARLMQKVVDYIHEHPGRIESIDASAHILHQIHKLTRSEIGIISQALAEEEGLLEPLD